MGFCNTMKSFIEFSFTEKSRSLSEVKIYLTVNQDSGICFIFEIIKTFILTEIIYQVKYESDYFPCFPKERKV